ncbi:MAG: DUF2236 domain-containing protein [Candidatus Rokubacteria bacterium]|nr:DUF2236 domain-containing protein [Candidatus Rokubacteria bacterium]
MAADRARLFAPGTTIWTVNRETALLLGAGRALLLQLAHPLVAAGVAEHSGFADDPFGRLLRTLDTSYAVVFGDADTAVAALRRMDAIHRRVRGSLREPVGPFPAGTPYDATDPALRLWVHATLIETSLLVYHRFVAGLSAADQARYYAESCEMARVLEIPEPMIPPTIEGFRTYFSRMLSAEIAVGATARELARLIFWPPRSASLRVIGPVAKFVTAGLLPPKVREGYGYAWTPLQEQALDTLARAIKRVVPAIPSVIRVVPQARVAEQRFAFAVPGRQAA